ncbi:hypothetical protein LTR93_011183 [Exophiala xenobiotica]|nr:hypothetical protein LTR93_011183 [Exophiala xenobiotica]
MAYQKATLVRWRDAIEEGLEVLVIGGGYGAQLVAVRLIEVGITNIRMVEKAGDSGGTWYWNRYPGAACEIASYIYMPLLEETGYIPTEKYARVSELKAHAEKIGHHGNLYDKAQTEVRTLEWDEQALLWTSTTNWGDKLRSRFVVPAAGPLHRPKLPGTKGIENSIAILSTLLVGTITILVATTLAIYTNSPISMSVQALRPSELSLIWGSGLRNFTSSSVHPLLSMFGGIDLQIPDFSNSLRPG